MSDVNDNSLAKRFHITYEISLIPSLIASAALIFSVWQYFDNKDAQVLLNKSQLIVRLDQCTNEASIEQDDIGYYISRVDSVTLSNTGFKSGSVVGWDLTIKSLSPEMRAQIQSERYAEQKHLFLLNGSIEGKLELTDGSEQIFPLILDAGSSNTFSLSYKVRITDTSRDRVMNHQIERNVSAGSPEKLFRLLEAEGALQAYMFILEFEKSVGEKVTVEIPSNCGAAPRLQGEL